MDDAVLKKKLNPAQYAVMRESAKETPYAGKFWDLNEEGTYLCAACETELFSSTEKFDVGNGFPAFHKPIDEKRLEFKQREGENGAVGIRCRKCKSNLGDAVAGAEPYYRLNSLSLSFRKKQKSESPSLVRPTSIKPVVPVETATPFKHASMFIAGAIVGGVLTAIALHALSQSSSPQPFPLSTSTSTTPVVSPASTTPIESPSATPTSSSTVPGDIPTPNTSF